MPSREEEWEALYSELLTLLAQFGRNDPFGDGDYWLVDDDWGGHRQKVCVSSPTFWSHDVQVAIQELLKRSFTHWGMVVVFEKASGLDRPGLAVYAKRIVHERRAGLTPRRARPRSA
jgi:hypothetical protein